MTLFSVNYLGYVLPLNEYKGPNSRLRYLKGFTGIFVLIDNTAVKYASEKELSEMTYQIPMPIFGVS